MSLIDPDVTVPGPRSWETNAVTPAMVLRLVLWGVVLAGAAVVVGWGLTRGAATGFSDAPGEQDEPATAATIIASFPLLVALGGWVAGASRNPRLPGWATAVGIALLGAATGHAVAAPPPRILQEPAIDAVTVGLGVAALALLVLGAVFRRTRVRRDAARRALVRSTPPVTGTVTNPGNMEFDDDEGSATWIVTGVSYAFRDASGTERHVTRTATVHRDSPIVIGEEVDIWYDRQDPSNEDLLVIRRRG